MAIAELDHDYPMQLDHLYADTINDVISWVLNEQGVLYVRYGEDYYYCERSEGFVIRDMTKVADAYGKPFWAAITGPLGSIEAAIDYPLLDGKSIRERFDEVEFLTD